jgi:hypothetical protein
MQDAVADILQWSDLNNLKINAKKTKEMVVYFGKKDLCLDSLTIDGVEIERVKQAKLLGLWISDDLKWGCHIDYICKKASKRLHYLRQLKRAGLSHADLVQVYTSMIRSLLETSVQVWSTGLPEALVHQLETIQKRACRIIHPWKTYQEALVELELTTLVHRRDFLNKKLFTEITKPDNRLNFLLPKKFESQYDLRRKRQFILPKCKTSRTKNSFIPFCLFNFQ